MKDIYKDEKTKQHLDKFDKEAFELKSIFIAIKLSAEGKRKDNG